MNKIYLVDYGNTVYPEEAWFIIANSSSEATSRAEYDPRFKVVEGYKSRLKAKSVKGYSTVRWYLRNYASFSPQLADKAIGELARTGYLNVMDWDPYSSAVLIDDTGKMEVQGRFFESLLEDIED